MRTFPHRQPGLLVPLDGGVFLKPPLGLRLAFPLPHTCLACLQRLAASLPCGTAASPAGREPSTHCNAGAAGWRLAQEPMEGGDAL